MSATALARKIRDELAARRVERGLQSVESVQHVDQDLREVNDGDHGLAVEGPETYFGLRVAVGCRQVFDLDDRVSEYGAVISHGLEGTRFWWWDDALAHALMLAEGTRLRHRVERDRVAGHWIVTLPDLDPWRVAL